MLSGMASNNWARFEIAIDSTPRTHCGCRELAIGRDEVGPAPFIWKICVASDSGTPKDAIHWRADNSKAARCPAYVRRTVLQRHRPGRR